MWQASWHDICLAHARGHAEHSGALRSGRKGRGKLPSPDQSRRHEREPPISLSTKEVISNGKEEGCEEEGYEEEGWEEEEVTRLDLARP